MRAVGLAAAALLLTACAARTPRPPAGAWPLPDPADCPLRDSVMQSLRLERGEKKLQLMAVLEPVEGGLQLAGLSLGNLRVLLIRWDSQGLHVEKDAKLPAAVDPGAVLRDVVLAYWPLASLRKGLEGSAWTLEEDAAGLRVLSLDGRPRLRVEPRRRGRKVWHLQEGYSVDAEDIEEFEDLLKFNGAIDDGKG